jgi:hypothetical protein
VLAAEKRAVEIDGVDAAPFGEGRRLDGAARANAGVVDERVETAEDARRLGEIGDPLLLVGHVVSEEDRTLADAPRRLASPRGVDIGDGDAGSLCRKGRRHGPPQARSAAGDERRLAGKPSRHALLRSQAPCPGGSR